MARGRFVSTSIAEDVELNSLTLEAHWLYLMTIPHLDRDGLIKGDTYVLFGKVCPRRPELIPHIDSLINEWVHAGLVLAYPTRDGRVLFFKGFTKNQQGMHYAREAASALQPPPGYIRTPDGLTPDKVRTNSGLSPAEVEVEDQVEEEVKAEAEGAAPPAATVDTDLARIWEAWDANMPGTKSPVIVDGVNSLLDDYSAAEIVEAIAIACRKNKRNLGYIQGILAKGAFSQPPTATGGDYRPAHGTNRGRNAAAAYMERKGMLNGRN